MPDSTIPAPVAADPIDRLTLGATDAREVVAAVGILSGCGGYCCNPLTTCMAEE
jgi:hypothetical protein